jgi:hypothetical protein
MYGHPHLFKQQTTNTCVIMVFMQNNIGDGSNKEVLVLG